MNKERNHAIEVYRYLFAFFVCTLHFKEYFGKPYPFGGAYLSVEFFLIIAGFFEMKHIYSRFSEKGSPEEGIGDYLLNRIKRLYPQYAISLLVYYIYRIFITNKLTVKEALIDYLPEWSMLQVFGYGKWLNSAMWYVSAMLVTSVIIYYFAVKNRKRFVCFIAPLGTLLIYSWLYQTNHGLGGIGLKTRTLLVCDGLWRAIAGMLLGCIIYAVYHKYKDWISGHLKVVRTLFEAGVIVLTCVLFYGSGNTVKDFTLIFLMALLILSVMSGGSYITQLLNKLPISGKYTYAIYCNHWVINYAIKEFFPGYPFYITLVIYLALTFVMSIVTTKLIELCTKAIQNRQKKLVSE